MAKIQGIEMAFIKSISTVENTQRWEVTYERDFTVGSLSKDFRSSVAEYTIAGTVGSANWTSWSGDALSTANNTNYTSTMAFNGSGMQIAPSEAALYDSTNFWDGFTNSPRIVAAIDELVPGYSAQDTVCVQLYAEASRTFAQDYEFMGLCMALQAGEDANDMFALASAQYNGSLKAINIRGDAGQNEGVGTMPTYFELIIYPGLNQTRLATGTWEGEFPVPGQAHTISSYQANHLACGNMTPANTYLGMTCSTATFTGTAVAFTSTGKKIRVSKLEAIEGATKGVSSCV